MPELSKEELDHYVRAGRVAQGALKHGVRLIKPGASMRETLDAVEEYIRKRGCEPAFPAQSCTNDIAAHYCPTEQDDVVYKETDLVKLDVGVHSDGHIGDNATTVSLDGKYDDLIAGVKEALDAAERLLRPGCTPDDTGAAIQSALEARGFRPVRNLTGHGLARYTVHTEPTMPNYASGERGALREGQVIAIEPFGTTGSAGMIYNAPSPTVFSQAGQAPVRSPYARAAYDIVKRYNGLPFTTRWITRELGGRGLLGLNELRRARMLTEYPPLKEKSGGIVAQHEHTFLITKTGYRRLTDDD